LLNKLNLSLRPVAGFLGTEPEKVLELLANTPDWSVFLDDEDL
jgi:hypothetical protein